MTKILFNQKYGGAWTLWKPNKPSRLGWTFEKSSKFPQLPWVPRKMLIFKTENKWLIKLWSLRYIKLTATVSRKWIWGKNNYICSIFFSLSSIIMNQECKYDGHWSSLEWFQDNWRVEKREKHVLNLLLLIKKEETYSTMTPFILNSTWRQASFQISCYKQKWNGNPYHTPSRFVS